MFIYKNVQNESIIEDEMIIDKDELADLKRNKSPEIINRIIHEAKRWKNFVKKEVLVVIPPELPSYFSYV